MLVMALLPSLPQNRDVLKPLELCKLWGHFLIKAVRKICSKGSPAHSLCLKRMKNKVPFHL